MVSRIIRFYTGDIYNHASIALDASLNDMYSFGRVNPYNPILGGFVKESPSSEFFRRFYNTDIAVIELKVESTQYDCIKEELEEMYGHKEEYHYNYKGLILAAFDRSRRKLGCYYCSEFVYEFFSNYGIDLGLSSNKTVRPMDFFSAPCGKVVYQGKISSYRYSITRKKRKAV